MAVMAMTATTTRVTILRPIAMTMTMQTMMMMVMTMTTNAILKMQEKMTTTRKMHVFLAAVITSMCAELLLRGRTKTFGCIDTTATAGDRPLPSRALRGRRTSLCRTEAAGTARGTSARR